ncbi:carbon-nitrogen hydrolase [Marinicauda pacifica]|uniref:Carbon-nitrogen hydrolase family protein n=1 Tax=Marinicauda pacifica TaxID=1133559 RepID=A0A4S2HE88_9PROT|nr:nitrilase-related carbon-nitrogen hydrolase [Marinicauda pacifica]TGY94183.1 carbon-nitrogen hydrolase family protein [Marinicauda pacifica]GGE33628.1 carbon-nitrogen hydrolase [Marinicauda pacifica]
MARFAIAQHGASSDVAVNMAKAVQMVEDAARQRAKLVCFPEIHLTPFFPKTRGGNAEAWRMAEDGPEIATFRDVARRHQIVIVSNLYLTGPDGKAYDASPIIDADGEILAVARMNQIAQFDGFWEQDYYAPGRGFEVHDTAAGRIGVVICFDRHFPESYRAVARAGADIVLTPTCIERDEPLSLFEAEMRTLSFHNSVYSLLANRCGEEVPRAYAGHSLICGPQGEVLARAGRESELLIADYDLEDRRRIARERGFLDAKLTIS